MRYNTYMHYVKLLIWQMSDLRVISSEIQVCRDQDAVHRWVKMDDDIDGKRPSVRKLWRHHSGILSIRKHSRHISIISHGALDEKKGWYFTSNLSPLMSVAVISSGRSCLSSGRPSTFWMENLRKKIKSKSRSLSRSPHWPQNSRSFPPLSKFHHVSRHCVTKHVGNKTATTKKQRTTHKK